MGHETFAAEFGFFQKPWQCTAMIQMKALYNNRNIIQDEKQMRKIEQLEKQVVGLLTD